MNDCDETKADPDLVFVLEGLGLLMRFPFTNVPFVLSRS